MLSQLFLSFFGFISKGTFSPDSHFSTFFLPAGTVFPSPIPSMPTAGAKKQRAVRLFAGRHAV